jgi:hypothetical protein
MATNQPRKLEDFGTLTKAEQQVLDELDTGEVIVPGDGKVPPEDAGPERQLRAHFLRWLALGGDDDPRLPGTRNGNPDHHCRRAARPPNRCVLARRPPSHPPPQGGRRLTAPPSLVAVAGLSGIIKSD